MNYADRYCRREPGDGYRGISGMTWGNVFYRAATILAALIALLAAGNYFYNIGQNRPLLPVVPLLVAGMIWLVGYSLRYLLTNR